MNKIYKNIYFWLVFLLLPCFVNADTVNVTALVGNVDIESVLFVNSPVDFSDVSHVEPLALNSSLSFSINIKDSDSSSLYYTITPNLGVSSVSNGVIDNSSLSASGNNLSFSYISPSSGSGSLETITIVVSDGSNIVSRNLSIFLY